MEIKKIYYNKYNIDLNFCKYLKGGEFKIKMKTWKRGRHPATPEQKAIADAKQKLRVKITNRVARNKYIKKECCMCGSKNENEITILHNEENPYYIAFICNTCRQDVHKILEAEKKRFNLQELIDEQVANREDNHYFKTADFTVEEVNAIVDGYVAYGNTMTMGEYSKAHNISRYQFNMLVEKYKEYNPDKANIIDNMVKTRSKAIQRSRLSIAANQRNMLKQKTKGGIIMKLRACLYNRR